MKNSKKISTYYNFEYLQLKNTKYAINASESQQIIFKFVKSPRGEINFRAPLRYSCTIFGPEASISVSYNVDT